MGLADRVYSSDEQWPSDDGAACDVCDLPADDDAGGDLIPVRDWRLADPVNVHFRCAPAPIRRQLDN